MSLLIKNTFYSTLSNILQSLANILVLVLLARPLGTEEFGRLLLAISFTSIFGTMVEYGFKWYAAKEVSQNPETARGVAGEIFNAQLFLAMGATLLAAFFAYLLAYPPRTVAVIGIIWVSAVLLALTQVIRSVFRGLNKFPNDTALNLILFTAMALTLTFALLFHSTTVAFAAAILGARAAYFAAGLSLFNKKVGRMDFRFSFRKSSRLLAGTLAYGTQIMIFRLLLEWNTIVLHQYRGNVGVGVYQAAFRCVMATMMVSDVLLQAFFPLIAKLAVLDRPRFIKTCAALNRYLLASGAYMAGAFFIFSGELVKGIFGAAYAPAAPVLKILAFAVMGYFLSSAPAIALIALGKQGTRARASALVLACNAVAAFVLIPAQGARGAAVAMAVAFALHAFLNSYFAYKTVKFLFFDRRSLYAALLLLVGSLAVLQLKNVSLFLGVSGYTALGAALFLAVTTRGEKKEILRVLRIRAAGTPGTKP